MSDSTRFRKVGDFLIRNFPKAQTIVDVAGGQGGLNKYLSSRGKDVITYDTKIRDRSIKHKKEFFTEYSKVEQDIIVGLHADAATDVVIKQAYLSARPFIVLPCCVLSTTTSFRGNFGQWCDHLVRYAKSLYLDVRCTVLPIRGKNVVIYGTPK